MSRRLNRRGYTFKKCVACGGKVAEKSCECGSRRWSWAYRVDVHEEGADRRQITRSGFEKKEDAQADLDIHLGEMRRGVFRPKEDTTLGDFLTEWIETIQRAESTLATYRRHIVNYIIPALGDVQLRNLDRNRTKRFYRSLAEDGAAVSGGQLSQRTIHRIHITLHSALQDAIADARLPANPADGAHSEPRVHRELTTWTASELRSFLDSVEDDRWYSMWRVSAMTGMRRAEVAGMKWTDLDLAARTLMVRRSRLRVQGKIIEKAPKTERGRRLIDLDGATVDALIAWEAQRGFERKRLQEELGDAYTDEGWVWAWEDGRPIDPTGISRSFSRLVGRATVPKIRLHDLRHTHASLLLQSGEPTHVVSRRLGHEKESFTLEVYAHVLPGQQQDAIERLSVLVDG